MITATQRKLPTGLDACQQKTIPLRNGRVVDLFVNQESGLIALSLSTADREESFELHRQYAQSARGYIAEWVDLPGRWSSLDADAPAMQSRAALRRSLAHALAAYEAREGVEGLKAA